MPDDRSESEPVEGIRTLVFPTAALVHLSGDRRGTTERLAKDVLVVGTSPDADVVLPPDPGPGPLPIHGTLHARGDTYELFSTAGADIWVNGELIESMVLASGDVLEFGKDGPILRYRIYPPGSPAYKTVSEAFSDCVERARQSGQTMLGKTAILATGVPGEIATQTSRAFRFGVLALLTILLGTTAALVGRNTALERRLTEQLARVEGIADLAARNERESLDADDLAELRQSLQSSLSDAAERLQTLEDRSSAPGRIANRAMAATLFIQGAYAFRDPASGRLLRQQLDPFGNPMRSPFGPALSLEGEGPVFEVLYTGTGFIVDASGLVMTNRHVALPWGFDESSQEILLHGFEGLMRRFQVYVPGSPSSLPARLVLSDSVADLAVLAVDGLPEEGTPLDFSDAQAVPGDAVVLVGYPLGVRALVARTDPAFMDALAISGETGFWSVARRLAEDGLIAPLVSRGIVGQASDQAVVYDAETTSGGSGGPVLGLDGSVIAVNSAILLEFGGSNLGVPAAKALDLLERARALLRRR